MIVVKNHTITHYIFMQKMAACDAENSHTGCKIPEEVFTILSSLNVCKFTKPVWNLYRMGKGYGLKLFWKTDGLVVNPTQIQVQENVEVVEGWRSF